MTDIAQKIEDRSYQSPQRARAALSRSHLSAVQKRKLGEAIQRWEDEGADEPPVVGGLPERAEAEQEIEHRRSHAAELVSPHDSMAAGSDVVGDGRLIGRTSGKVTHSSGAFTLPVTVNLNAFISAKLTSYGVHVLYGARKKVPVPDDLLAQGGVWNTTLAHFMIAFGEHLEGPDNDVPVEGFEITLRHVRA